MAQLPSDIKCISAPLLIFCGDTGLAVYLADRFFRDGTPHYNIEFLDEKETTGSEKEQEYYEDNRSFIMKDNWYYKHSHKQPALCLFCVSVDLQKISIDHTVWVKSICAQFEAIKSRFLDNVPAFLSIFVCPGNRHSLENGPIREDNLIREQVLLSIPYL